MIIKHIKNNCKYYRKMNETYDMNHMGPEDLCLDLYHSAYPYCLAILYGAKFTWMDDKTCVCGQCPYGRVHFKVKRIPIEEEKEGIKKTCRIIIEIISSNNCYNNHIVGEEYEFNQGDLLDQMCPAAFYNIYPILKCTSTDVNVECPDNNTKIGFEVIHDE